MTVVQSRTEATSTTPPPGDPEALFKEARQRRRRRWLLGSGIACFLVVFLILGVLIAAGAGGGGRLGQGAARPCQHDTGRSAGLSLSNGTFAVMGTGILANAFDCASPKTCFAVAYPQPGDALHDWASSGGRNQVVKTTDGGATWAHLADFPRQWTPAPVLSCPTATACAVAVQRTAPHNNWLPARAIAVTRDGGSSWLIRQLPLPSDLVDGSVHRLACTDGLRCLADVVGEGSTGPHAGFFFTRDGGTHWIESDAVLPASEVGSLRCDPDGRCIALETSGSGMTAFTSSDFGAVWIQGAASQVPTSSIIISSCGDATHCVYSTAGGEFESTNDGGETWDVSRPSRSSGQIVTALDCPDGTVCFAAAAGWHEGNYTSPVVYRTSDAGGVWTRLDVPSRFDGWSVSTVVPLSCPTPGGCIGIAQATPRSSRPMTKRLAISTFR